MSTAYYETAVQEDLDCGTALVTKRGPSGGAVTATQVGIHTIGTGQRAVTADWTPGAITAGSLVSTTVAYPDAVTNDFVLVSHTGVGSEGLLLTGHVAASDVVTVVLSNLTGEDITVPAGTLSVLVLRSISTSLDPPPEASFTKDKTQLLFGELPGDVTFTDTSTGFIDSWDWDFGDGEAHSTAQNPVHTYAFHTTIVYTITLTVTGPGGSDSATDTITINPPI